jgi:CO/xanthine dehydrogenase Mo-binding subunit
VWKASRNVYGDRDKLAKVFGLTHDQVRVNGPYMGGGFGSKDETRLAAITALLARKAGKPVRMGYTQEEELGCGKWRHATTTRIRMGLKRDGTITAIDATSALNTGPYAPGFGVASRLGHGLTYLYSCPDARFVGKVAFTNSPVAGSYRGLGAPQAHFALESLADEAAEKLHWTRWSFDAAIMLGRQGSPASVSLRRIVLCPRSPSKAEFRSPAISWRNASTKALSESAGSRAPPDPEGSKWTANFAAWESPVASTRPARSNRLRL